MSQNIVRLVSRFVRLVSRIFGSDLGSGRVQKWALEKVRGNVHDFERKCTNPGSILYYLGVERTCEYSRVFGESSNFLHFFSVLYFHNVTKLRFEVTSQNYLPKIDDLSL